MPRYAAGRKAITVKVTYGFVIYFPKRRYGKAAGIAKMASVTYLFQPVA